MCWHRFFVPVPLLYADTAGTARVIAAGFDVVVLRARARAYLIRGAREFRLLPSALILRADTAHEPSRSNTRVREIKARESDEECSVNTSGVSLLFFGGFRDAVTPPLVN